MCCSIELLLWSYGKDDWTPPPIPRNATYYHRAAIPIDINNTCPKSEGTFSLNTKDRAEAVRLVRIAAADVDRKFEEHRRKLSAQNQPPLSFSKAAPRVGITQSSASRYISNLEDELGVQLLQRSTRKLNLLEAGQIYYDRSRQIIADIDEAHLALNR